MARSVSSRFIFTSLICAAAVTVPLVTLTGQQSGRIIGRVIGRDSGRALAAELGLVIRDRRGITMKHIRVSDTGEFEITEFPDGSAHLTTKLAGYAVEHENLVVHSGETQQVEFRLLKAKTVRGVIVDPTGRALEGAQMRVIYASEETQRDSLSVTYQWEMGEVKSDEHGRFTLEAHPEREFVIEASYPSYIGEVSEPSRIDPAESQVSVRLSLRAGVRVTGEARDEGGRLIPGAQVSLIEMEERPELRRFISAERLSRRTMQTVSGPDGQFRFDNASPAHKTLIITHPDHKPIRQTLDVTSGRDAQPARVTLQGRGVR